jgi:hypothetical protein
MATIDGYDLDTLNIMMYNNIDPKKPIELDAKMFLFDKPIKSDNGKMWVCTNIRYSEEVLMIKTHYECVQTFFDQALFLKYIKESSIKKPNNDPSDVRKIDEDKWANSEAEGNKNCKLKHLCFMKENMLLALKYCFPVTFPVDSPPYSFSKGQPDSITVGKFINSWFNSDKYANFTHMKIDSKDATVIKCQWLDTIKFHPVYQKVNKGIKQYFVNVKGPLIKLLEQVIKLMEKTIIIKDTNISNDFYQTTISGLFSIYINDYYSNKNTTLKNYATKKLKLEYSVSLIEEEEIINIIRNANNNLESSIDNTKINNLFSIFYYLYYLCHKVNFSNNTIESFKSDTGFNQIEKMTLENIITKYNKELKQKLDLILLLCSVHSKEGYNQFVRDIGMDQVTLQKYDFHKPYVQLFESLTMPNRKSTNGDINNLFDLIGYEIPGLYNIYGEDGFYDVVNNKDKDTYIGFDRINLSADKKKAPHLEIYLAMEFAGGLVTDANKGAVGCLFENNRLGRMLEKIIKKEKESEDILEMREYIDLTALIKKTEKDIKIQEAKEAKAAKDAQKTASQTQSSLPQTTATSQPTATSQTTTTSQSKDDLLQVEIDKLPGVSQDIRKKIMEKINKEIPSVKELSDTITKYNKDLSLKSAYDKILTKAQNDIETLIKNSTYDVEKNPDLAYDKKEKARLDVLDYTNIKDLIGQLTQQASFAEKVKTGGRTRRHRKRRRQRKTRRHYTH